MQIVDEFCSRVTPELPLSISDTDTRSQLHQLHCTTSQYFAFLIVILSNTPIAPAPALHFVLHCICTALHFALHCIPLHCIAFLIAELHSRACSIAQMQKSTLYSVQCRAFNTMCVIYVLRSAEQEIYMCDKMCTVHCALCTVQCTVRSELCNVQSSANDPRCLLLQFSTHLSHSFAAN